MVFFSFHMIEIYSMNIFVNFFFIYTNSDFRFDFCKLRIEEKELCINRKRLFIQLLVKVLFTPPILTQINMILRFSKKTVHFSPIDFRWRMKEEAHTYTTRKRRMPTFSS